MPLGNFAADSLRWKFGTDVGLVNSGALRGDRVFPAGEIPIKWLADIFPFGNTIDIVSLTGAQLRQVMELSASALMREDENYDPAFRVPDGGFLQVSGLKVVYDLQGKPTLFDAEGKLGSWGTRLRSLSVWKDGEWREVDDAQTYTVAVNAWTAGGGDRYFVFGEGKRMPTELRDLDVLLDYILSFPEGRVAPETDGRIEIKGR